MSDSARTITKLAGMVRRRWFLFVKDQQNRKVTDRINRYNKGVEGGMSLPTIRDGERDAIPREQTIFLQMMKNAWFHNRGSQKSEVSSRVG